MLAKISGVIFAIMAFHIQLETVQQAIPLARHRIGKISDWYTQTTGPHVAEKEMVNMYTDTTASQASTGTFADNPTNLKRDVEREVPTTKKVLARSTGRIC